MTRWLREAIRAGWVGDFRGSLPNKVWMRRDGVVYEAHITQGGNAEYYGYPLDSFQQVGGLP